jgi:hypothetical protein
MIMCLWGDSTLVKSVWCSGDFLHLRGKTSSGFGEFSVIILLNIIHIPLACSFFFFSLISVLSLSSEILSYTCSVLLEWPSTVFFV